MLAYVPRQLAAYRTLFMLRSLHPIEVVSIIAKKKKTEIFPVYSYSRTTTIQQNHEAAVFVTPLRKKSLKQPVG